MALSFVEAMVAMFFAICTWNLDCCKNSHRCGRKAEQPIIMHEKGYAKKIGIIYK